MSYSAPTGRVLGSEPSSCAASVASADAVLVHAPNPDLMCLDRLALGLPAVCNGAAPDAQLVDAMAQRLGLETGSVKLDRVGSGAKVCASAALLVGSASPLRGASAVLQQRPDTNGLTVARRASKSELDKELLRKQAADMAKSIEFKCLEGLDGSAGSGSTNSLCKSKGPPMLATRSLAHSTN